MTSPEAVDNFRAVTGCSDEQEASHFLEACGGNLAAAVDLFFQRQQTDLDDVRARPSSSSSSSVAATRHVATQPSTSNDDDADIAMASDGDEDIRAPMAPTSGVIVEQSYDQAYNLRNKRRPMANSVFDRFRDFRAVARDQREMLTRDGRVTVQNNNAEVENKRQTLESLFRPPIELLHNGSWESARREAESQGRWLLVNVQNVEEFACQTLNRDVWANDGVKELVRNNFVLWQIYHDAPDGRRIEMYYRQAHHPAIFVVDPRTGEFITSFSRVQDAVSFCDQVMAFLEQHPDFAHRDRDISAGIVHPNESVSTSPVASPASSSTATTSAVANGIEKKRKRKASMEDKNGHANGRPVSPSASDPPLKSARHGLDNQSMPDIEELINGGEKLTTTDRDEWMKHLGKKAAEGEETTTLMLRLPDGSRERLTLSIRVTLKVVFLFVAGRGYCSADHVLVLSFPKREFSIDDEAMSLEAAQFGRQEVIDVERK